MSKLHWMNGESIAFWCPGCDCAHGLRVAGPRGVWTWNGSEQRPTFLPSVLANPDDPRSRCHAFVKAGMIQFLPDCYHHLAGKTVDLPDWPSSEPGGQR